MATSYFREPTTSSCGSSPVDTKPRKKFKFCSKNSHESSCWSMKSYINDENLLLPKREGRGSKNTIEKQSYLQEKFQDLYSLFFVEDTLNENCSVREVSSSNSLSANSSEPESSIETSRYDSARLSQCSSSASNQFIIPSVLGVDTSGLKCLRKASNEHILESRPRCSSQDNRLSDVSNKDLNIKKSKGKKGNILSCIHCHKKVSCTITGKENQIQNSSVQDVHTEIASKPIQRAKILVSKPEDFHNHHKNQFDLLRSSFFSTKEPEIPNTVQNGAFFDRGIIQYKHSHYGENSSLGVNQSTGLEVGNVTSLVEKTEFEHFSQSAKHQQSLQEELADKSLLLERSSKYQRRSSLIGQGACIDSRTELNLEDPCIKENGFEDNENETLELSSNSCEVLFSSVMEWKKFFPPAKSGTNYNAVINAIDFNSHSGLIFDSKKNNLTSFDNDTMEVNRNNSLFLNQRHKNSESNTKAGKPTYLQKKSSHLNHPIVEKEVSQISAKQSDHLKYRETDVKRIVKSVTKSFPTDFKIPSQTVKQSCMKKKSETRLTKLFIIDLLKVTPTSQRNRYMFHDKIVHRVDVFGVITGVRPVGNGKIIYEVDDGSGTISCVYKIAKIEAKVKKLNLSLLSKMSSNILNDDSVNETEVTVTNNSIIEKHFNHYRALNEFRHCMANHSARYEESFYKIGDTIHAKGVLYDFRGIISFYTYDIRKVLNLEEETYRYLQVAALYQSVYFKTIGIATPD